jgi:rsbT co-antagonist protein RsbR
MKESKKKSSQNDFKMTNQVLNQIPTPVMAVDIDLKIVYMNDVALSTIGKEFDEVKGKQCADIFNSAHCNTPECRMKQAIESGEPKTARNEVTIDGAQVPIEYYAAPLKDDDGNIVGGLEYILDITERVKHEERLRQQARTISEISTPTIKLWDGIVVLPVIGVVDSNRAQQMMEKMLQKIVSTSAKVIILDISGVAAVDTAVANHLIKITKATQLLGCRCVISGVSPAVAQTIINLGIDMEGIYTNSTLSDALQEAFTYINLEVKNIRNK